MPCLTQHAWLISSLIRRCSARQGAVARVGAARGAAVLAHGRAAVGLGWRAAVAAPARRATPPSTTLEPSFLNSTSIAKAMAVALATAPRCTW
jgi:hypothetical protein